MVIVLDGTFEDPPLAPNAYELTHTTGDLTVGEVTYDAATKTVTLVTSKQKLGIEYHVTIVAPGHPLDLAIGKFLSADTAKFWATDFSDFSDFEVVAERVGVGENIVLYSTPEGMADDVEETIEYFDERIFPIETDLLAPAPDRDGNGKIVLLGLDGEQYYGGYFNPMNALTEAEAQQFQSHSNEKEMLYVSVADLQGSFGAEAVVAHEFSHLLYNELHDFFNDDWAWHNEGLAECAVHAVSGQNQYAADFYLAANGLADGQSLVKWQYSNYDQYAQSYVFLTYVASRLGGVEGFGQLFQLSGDPVDVGAFFEQEIGQTFSEVHLDMLTAAWSQAATGPFGFEGMIDFGGRPQTATTSPLSLEITEGVFFGADSNGLVPAGAGPDAVFRGINGEGVVDDTAPFAAQGGVVIALNTDLAPSNEEQSSGTLGVAVNGVTRRLSLEDRAWMHPPPVKPANRAQLLAWRKQVHGF